jgi:hypothetical protein
MRSDTIVLPIGKKFNRWTVIGSAAKKNLDVRKTYFLCKCDCGTEKLVSSTLLRKGESKSCGCFQSDMIKNASEKHGMHLTRTYSSWKCSIQRCHNINHKGYKNYGGRGIIVCDRWREFINFFNDMGERPKGCVLDRINNEGNYCKDNCRWVTVTQNNCNKRNSKFHTINGVTKNVSTWAKDLGIPKSSLRYKIKKELI